jgi:hypothetical protein
MAWEGMVGQQRHRFNTGQRGAMLRDDVRPARRQLGYSFERAVV